MMTERDVEKYHWIFRVKSIKENILDENKKDDIQVFKGYVWYLLIFIQ